MPRQTITAFGHQWKPGTTWVEVHQWCIRRGEEWLRSQGRSLFYHYRELQKLFWPEDDHHDWSDLILQTILDHRMTCVLGAKDSGKTSAMARYALTDYWTFPQETLIVMSSTDLRGLELRVWGEIKDLYTRAKTICPCLPGRAVDYLHAISTDDLDDPDVMVRTLRRGLICVPAISSGGGYNQGLSKFAGVKQKRRRLLGDEVTWMPEAYLDVPANWNSGDFKGVFLGNPLGVGDTLDRLAEPKDGWASLPEVSATTTWENRWPEGRTVNLVGTDSPNCRADPQRTGAKRYWYMIGWKEIEDVAAFYGRNSVQYYSQALGIRKTGLLDYRVMTRELCQQFGAFEPVVWGIKPATRVYAVDPGYGGDRCIAGYADFGEDINGRQVLAFGPPAVVPVRPDPAKIAEDQIAEFVRDHASSLGVAPERVFYDSTGRGALGNAFSRAWSAMTNAVEFGGSPTARPVCNDLFITDPKTQQRRLKRCDEHYIKFVTELAFSLRYLIESRQVRSLPQEVAYELSHQEWLPLLARGNRIELEPKEKTKERLKRSPDAADMAKVLVEGARRLGLTIARMTPPPSAAEDPRWRQDLRDRAERLRKSYALAH